MNQTTLAWMALAMTVSTSTCMAMGKEIPMPVEEAQWIPVNQNDDVNTFWSRDSQGNGNEVTFLHLFQFPKAIYKGPEKFGPIKSVMTRHLANCQEGSARAVWTRMSDGDLGQGKVILELAADGPWKTHPEASSMAKAIKLACQAH